MYLHAQVKRLSSAHDAVMMFMRVTKHLLHNLANGSCLVAALAPQRINKLPSIARAQRVMPSSHHRLSCLVGVGGVNWTGDKSRLSAKLFSREYIEDYQKNCLRLPPTQFTPPTPMRREGLVDNQSCDSTSNSQHPHRITTMLVTLQWLTSAPRLLNITRSSLRYSKNIASSSPCHFIHTCTNSRNM